MTGFSGIVGKVVKVNTLGRLEKGVRNKHPGAEFAASH